MIKQYVNLFRRLMIFADLIIVTAAFFTAYFLRDQMQDIMPLSYYLAFLPLAIALWVGFSNFLGMYQSFRVQKIPAILITILETATLSFIFFGFILYLLKIEGISRLLVFLIFASSAVFFIVQKLILVLFFRYIRKKGLNYKNILIVGTGKRAQHFIDIVNRHSEWGLKISGLVDQDESKIGSTINNVNVIGSFKDMPGIIHNSVIDEVVFVVPRSWLDKIEDLIHQCEIEGIKIHVAVDHFDLKFSRASTTEIHGFPMITFESTPEKISHLALKRFSDFILSGLALLLLSPVFIIISIIIKITSNGPIFFKQERVGLNGRKFTLIKFRTMVKDAEIKLTDLLAHNEMDGPVFKMANDPRITPFGKFLRKLSLDELPQLWNVLSGDMSLVGPRPPLPSEVTLYDNWQRRRLSMKPGLTCIWQTSGRNKIVDFNEWAKLDLEYIDNWSLMLDVRLILKTIPVVLFGIGAK